MSVFCLLYLAVIGSALTFLLLYWLLPRMTVTGLQAISLITPPGAVMLGWWVGGDEQRAADRDDESSPHGISRLTWR